MLEDFVGALMCVIEAQSKHDKALADYTGFSWAYHGRYEKKQIEEAQDRFKDALRDVVFDLIEEYDRDRRGT